jgi:hypothetical protein
VGIGSVFHFGDLVPRGVYAILSFPVKAIFYEGKIIETQFHTGNSKNKKKWRYGIALFFKTLIFSLGLILISYLSLDGEIRVYLILFSLIGFCLSFAVRFVLNKFLRLIIFIYRYILIFARYIFYPIHFVLYRLRSLFLKLCSSVEVRLPKIVKNKGGEKNE